MKPLPGPIAGLGRRRRPNPVTAALALASTCLVGGARFDTPAQAFQATPTPAPRTSTSAADTALEAAPFTAESIGFSIRLPAGALVSAEKINGKLVIGVREKDAAPTWNMRIQQMAPSKDQLTPAGEIDDLLTELKTSGQPHRLLANQAVEVNGLQGQLCYLERQNDQGQAYVSGWLVLPHGQGLFLVCSINTVAEHMPRLRPLLNASFGTIRLRSADDLAQEREARLAAGRSLLAAITPNQLESLAGTTQWYRIYKPESDGGRPVERGYSMVEIQAGAKGALNPGRSEANYSADEKKIGLLVRLQGRAVINPEKDTYYDSIALYWMAWDQSEEAWSIRGTYRRGEDEQTEAETGVRTPPTPGTAPRLTVLKADSATNSRDPFDWAVPDAYLSQPLPWVIGRIMPRDSAQGREYAYYSYHSAGGEPQVSQRVDLWGPANDGSAAFQLITRMTTDGPATTSLYNRDGDLVRRVHADGTVTEPASVAQLRQFWKAGGLQLGVPGK